MAEKLTISLTVLLTGFVVVFTVLLLLICIIKLYGTIVYKIQTKKSKDIAEENANAKQDLSAFDAQPAEIQQSSSDELEVVAAISAAVYSLYSSSSVKIKSIRKRKEKSSAWRNAGIMDNTRAF